jgi:hypothetical protein
MSSKYLGESGCIEQLPGLFDGVDKIWVSKAAASQKVHLAAEELLKCLEKTEVLIGEAHRVYGQKLHEKVQITIFAEITGGRRAEDFETSNVVLEAGVRLADPDCRIEAPN